MTTPRLRILVALDESGHGRYIVRYINRLLKPGAVEFVLFSVLSKMPERFWDMEEHPAAEHQETAVKRWKASQEKSMADFMVDAVNLLTHQGVPTDAIKVKLQNRITGIARDILQEAKNGYDAVVVGRQGINPITRLVIGSVTGKLIQTLTDLPLWIVGSGLKNNRVLLAMDASEGSMRAVSHISAFLGGTDAEVTLFHVIRSVYPTPFDSVSEESEAAKLEALVIESREKRAIMEAFQEASQILQKAGVRADHIAKKVVSGVATRSGAIAAQAMVGGYSTIVMGRRGHSRVGEFHMGRVTNKVIQLTSEAAVWLVS